MVNEERETVDDRAEPRYAPHDRTLALSPIDLSETKPFGCGQGNGLTSQGSLTDQQMGGNVSPPPLVQR
jgi:hypothetical protein